MSKSKSYPRSHPLLFSQPMVKQLLKNNKTHTRRAVANYNSLVDGRRVTKKTWDSYAFDWNDVVIDSGPSPAGNPGPYLKVKSRTHDTRHRIYPIYQLDDLIWVKETWAYLCDEKYCCGNFPCIEENQQVKVEYRADTGNKYPGRWDDAAKEDVPDSMRWRSPLFLKKEDARLWLKIDRQPFPQRIQSISEEDCKAEGCVALHHPKQEFFHLWLEINGEQSWTDNVWVWAIPFHEVFHLNIKTEHE